MSAYVPKGKALKAMEHLDEEGAQYAVDLARHVDVLRTDLKRTMEYALRNGVVGCEYRIRRGLKQSKLYFLTDSGRDLMNQIRQAQGVAA